jgi:hypothetical protein
MRLAGKTPFMSGGSRGIGLLLQSEVDPQKRTPFEEEVPKWASIVPRTRWNSGRRWLSW